MSKLALTTKILDLTPIKNADKIELATVYGWQVIVKKDEFKIGDLCIYICIDTVVDNTKPYFSFLERNGKIQTKKIRGVYSQGLILNLNNFPDKVFEENMDVTEFLGVKKYEKDASIICPKNEIFKPFPSDLISKTDEDHLKSSYKCCQEFIDTEIYISLKIDGCSVTMIKSGDNFMVCSRNYEVTEESPIYKFAINNLDIKNKLNELNKNIAIQGELCGPKINGNKLNLDKLDFYVFTVKDLSTGEFYSLDQLQKICQVLNLNLVPILDTFICDNSWDIKKFQEYANQVKYKLGGYGEGIVVRPTKPKLSVILGKYLSCKVINQNYKD
jgi:RNA ligase (TIGR02306 family)